MLDTCERRAHKNSWIMLTAARKVALCRKSVPRACVDCVEPPRPSLKSSDGRTDATRDATGQGQAGSQATTVGIAAAVIQGRTDSELYVALDNIVMGNMTPFGMLYYSSNFNNIRTP